MSLAVMAAQAQILIGGSVYGGGNQGEVSGNSTVTVREGDINKVYGGARMADVKGRALVHLDGEHASNYVLINYVYGGNDIAGKIGTFKTLPTDTLTQTTANGIDNTWNAFVRISNKKIPYTAEEIAAAKEGDDAYGKTTDDKHDNQKIYVGQLFAGGNGDYSYVENANGKYDLTIGDDIFEDIDKPELERAYLEILGGSMVYAFGGGNNVTVKQKTVIYVNNPSEVVSSIIDISNPKAGTDGELLTTDRTLYGMGLNTETTYPTSNAFQIGSFFGGNNKAEMSIQPVWHLIDGKIRNIYSGGNMGDMTSSVGLLLEIPENSTIKADNVYGGCRRANVDPKNPDGTSVTSVPNLDGYKFPPGLSARVLIRGGDINNVYGGNDISGSVWGGSAVGIYHSIRGDVYGGGNGSYAYTDNPALKDDLTWGDFYYDVKTILGTDAASWTFANNQSQSDVNQLLSVRALNAHRPNVAQTSVRLWGPDEDHPTIIGGSVYMGGNSATVLKSNEAKMVELKIGSYVIADNVFLGNNGEHMVNASSTGPLAKYAGKVENYEGNEVDFSSLNFKNATPPSGTDKPLFGIYMEGAEMTQKPSVVFDATPADPNNYLPYSTYFGSFYCGCNRGSMNVSACTEIDINEEVVIFDKLVGGCNDAFIPETTYNVAFDGGLIGTPPADGDDKGIKLKLNIGGLKIQPKRWVIEDGKKTRLEWNTVDANGSPVDPVTEITKDAGKDYETSDDADKTRRLEGGNIYGGCYSSGHVNGDVVININSTIIDRDKLFDEVATNDLGEEISLYGSDLLNQKEEYHITKRNTGVILGLQGMDVLGKALNVFGGGKGKGTEIWGSTTINLNQGYVFQVFGGSEEGVIGKPSDDGNYLFTYAPDENKPTETITKKYKNDDAYSCYINLNGPVKGVSKNVIVDPNDGVMAEAEFIYGGAFLGPIAGNTVINLGNGRIFNSFAGSCNGDILGHTETYIGGDGTTVTGFPYIRDYVYGGNDLGGEIKGKKDFVDRKSANCPITLHSADVTTASAYTEYTQGRVLGIFGGCFGTYDYKDPKYSAYTDNNGNAKDGFTKPRMDNAFVNFRPTKTDLLMTNDNNKVDVIYGGGQGYPGDGDRDIMQNRSYILIDIPQEMTNYKDLEVFGAGAWSGQGMRTYLNPNTTDESELHKVSAIIDLARGQISSVYGGSFKEGFTRRTAVCVPENSTISLGYQTVETDSQGKTYTVTHGGSIFGGAYGETNENVCDVYEANVEYHSKDARVFYVYGGNNAYRRTLYGRVNIDVPVWTKEPNTKWLATVYGAGYGENTWSQYTEVNLNGKKDNTGNIIGGAKVYQVFGGGYNGKVMNKATVQKWATDNDFPLGMGVYAATGKEDVTGLGLDNPLVKLTELGDTCNTNVRIYRGATSGHDAITKGGYAYGGGQGSKNIDKSGDVNGSTYIALLGGTAFRDIYAAGTVGAVLDEYGSALPEEQRFTATANAYIAGGSVRNVYGGGYMGSVGLHEVNGKRTGDISGDTDNDILGKTNVVIGIRKDQTETNLLKDIRAVLGSDATINDYGYYCGVPTVQRNAYGGGEGETEKGGRGGAVFGESNLTLNNGAIGYYYCYDPTNYNYDLSNTATVDGLPAGYVRKIDDETRFDDKNNWIGEGKLRDYGCLFGGGYSDRSNVDFTNVTMWGGVLRGSMHGGAEVAAVGRGATKEEDNSAKRTLLAIYKPGGTKVTMYDGHVMRNVFGGGKGYNEQGFGGGNALYTDGYVFGQTEVYIYGGEVGTVEGVVVQEDGTGGYGNVFGGGDIGYVYGKGFFNAKTQAEKDISTGSPGHHYYYSDYQCNADYGSYKKGDVINATTYDALSTDDQAHWTKGNFLTEDCKVVVSPYLQVKTACVINGHSFDKYAYVPTEDLNTLPKKDNGTYGGDWLNLYTGADKNSTDPDADDKEERGVIIHNAVFAGGNVSTKKETFANAKTVYGNTTATLNDVYHRDFISVGTEHIGGLYGGGNLSLVDGYRELNITNYGTDYYGLNERITLTEYNNMSNRERAYFQLEYVCQVNYTGADGTVYTKDISKIPEEDFNHLPSGEQANWQPFGFCSIYAGRLLNTIQRADFCGVFGSRMVLQGAKDRVPDVADATPYTINRVGELSLNKQYSAISTDTGDDATHGNYFGIYSYVNCLGNLTSDVKFYEDKRQVLQKDGNGNVQKDENGKDIIVDASDDTYYEYKAAAPKAKNRNEGCSLNQVALASGVFLELTTEETTEEKKVYGYITGVIELDLINVKQDIVGGGYVYAKNEHGTRYEKQNVNTVILSPYNKQTGNEVHTYKLYGYSEETSDLEEIETSGNFIHRSKTIIDDCYPTNYAYNPKNKPYSEAHYWYIKGSVYVYEQIVSAYTGSANAYSKEVFLPLTITAASNGKLKLLNVKPNKYAYYKEYTSASVNTPMGVDDEIKVNNEVDIYHLNDVISYWDWSLLPSSEQAYFVDQTYVNAMTVKVGGENGTEYAPGTRVMTDLSAFNETITYTNAKGELVTISSGETGYANAKKYVFRLSNDISHDTGYVLTFDMKNPKDWDNWFSIKDMKDGYSKIDSLTYKNKSATDQLLYLEGPTFRPTVSDTYGQKEHTVGEIITKEVYNLYPTDDKSKADVAYVAKETVTYSYNSVNKTVNKGTPIPASEYSAVASISGKFDKAYVCFSTLQLDEEKYITKGDLLTKDEITTLRTTYPDLADKIYAEDGEGEIIGGVMTEAYICKEDGKYGGQDYSTNTNYSAIGSWCSINQDERDKFEFNYDALDLLIDENYTGVPARYDVKTGTPTPALYSAEKSVEYEATLDVSKLPSGTTSVTYSDSEGTHTIDSSHPTVSSDIYEQYITNEKRHYTKLPEISYVAKEGFTYGGVTYTEGSIVPFDVYTVSQTTGSEIYGKVEMVDKVYVANDNFIYKGEPYSIGQTVTKVVYDASRETGSDINGKVSEVPLVDATPYYCYEDYKKTNGTTVSAGVKIGTDAYNDLPNDQQYFTIQGTQPTETTTLYVSSESDAYNLSKEKIITVVYQYTYNEEAEGGGLKTTSELHVVNIHLQMESGVPEIGPLAPPATVLPGETVGMERPTVSEGLYEILTTGWELYASKDDAEHHRNGKPFVNGGTPVYWYQNGHDDMGGYVAFYAQTYLGYTYSRPVPLSVANYHDLKDVMADTENHYFIDQIGVERAPKIYINDYSGDETPQNGLDLLKDLFTLSTVGLTGHTSLSTSQVGACKNLEFILRTDINHTESWAGIGTDNTATGCFDGTLHGDGHTISGLDHSLFNHLCGDVYNLGVTGSFTSAGIADNGTGYLENCWIMSDNNTAKDENVQPVFDNPTNATPISGETPRTIHIVNCYYPTENQYTAHATDATYGKPTEKPLKSFYNGEVAYNLNDFYLFKRYCDNTSSLTNNDYTYLIDEGATDTDGNKILTPHTGHYADKEGPYLMNDANGHYVGSYVESRYVDGDFIYDAGNKGEIPQKGNIRYYTYTDNSTSPATVKSGYAPIWPDDYFFFGQMLNYGHGDANGPKHQDQPSIINRDADNDLCLMTGDNSNRVYRAPGYFQSSTMSVAHFNPNAIFAKTKNGDDNVIAYKDMTAIDFTGGNGDVSGGYVFGTEAEASGNRPAGVFYPPLLDDDGLIGFKNIDLTKNLLVYTGTSTTAMTTTDGVVKAYLGDGKYDVTNDTYGTVDPWDTDADLIRGHRVALVEGNYVSQNDHLLVDKQDFFCPIAYSMGSTNRMWYQRTPDNYVDRTKGWEGISIPFTADIVTTQTKGELTHFYTYTEGGKDESKGHEYWLRKFDGNMKLKTGETAVYEAAFNCPAATGNTADDKEVTNTYLWDWYYNETTTPHHQDLNNDIYQTYYESPRTYYQYPRLTAAIPYIIGFPGETYYEFDLSGKWTPSTTASPQPGKLTAQVVTFASKEAATIPVSSETGVSWSGTVDSKAISCTFHPSFLNRTFAAGTADTFTLNANGSSYDAIPSATTPPADPAADTEVFAFRPYITMTVTSSGARPVTRSIVFTNDDAQLKGVEEHGNPSDEEAGGLNIYAKKHKIIVESALNYTTDVRIVNMAGITVNTFSIEPGETVETRIYNAGVYIVQTDDTRYTKKLAVK